MNMIRRDYQKSIYGALIDVYPTHEWKAWKFSKSPLGWWRTQALKLANGDPQAIRIIKDYLEELASHHGISNPTEWLSNSHKLRQVDNNRLNTLNGLNRVLAIVYPDLPWPETPTLPCTTYTDRTLYLSNWAASS